MKDLYTSISAVILIIFSITSSFLSWQGIIDPKDFVALVSMFFGYYFGRKKGMDEGQNLSDKK